MSLGYSWARSALTRSVREYFQAFISAAATSLPVVVFEALQNHIFDVVVITVVHKLRLGRFVNGQDPSSLLKLSNHSWSYFFAVLRAFSTGHFTAFRRSLRCAAASRLTSSTEARGTKYMSASTSSSSAACAVSGLWTPDLKAPSLSLW